MDMIEVAIEAVEAVFDWRAFLEEYYKDSKNPEAEMEKETNDCDIALLGPQVGYRLKAAEQICKPKNIPVAVIPMVDYGMMNGKNVLDFALKLK